MNDAKPHDTTARSFEYWPDDRILSERDTEAFTSLKRTARYEARRRGDFPQPIQLSPGRIGYRLGELRAWLASRPRVGTQAAA